MLFYPRYFFVITLGSVSLLTIVLSSALRHIQMAAILLDRLEMLVSRS